MDPDTWLTECVGSMLAGDDLFSAEVDRVAGAGLEAGTAGSIKWSRVIRHVVHSCAPSHTDARHLIRHVVFPR